MNENLISFYDEVYKKGPDNHFTTVTGETEEILKSINWIDKTVLEAGCGEGEFSFEVAKLCKYVIGVDYSKEAINIANKKYKKNNLVYDIRDIKNIKDNYDVIVCVGTLEHMDNALETIQLFKKHLNKNGKIIITCPNWTNVRGYVLMTLYHLFDALVTLADLHYLTPTDFVEYAKELKMNMRYRTFDESWASGDVMIKDFKKRLPKLYPKSQTDKLVKWLEEKVIPLEHQTPNSGATGIYIFEAQT